MAMSDITLRKFAVSTVECTYLFDCDDISHGEAYGDCTKIHFIKEKKELLNKFIVDTRNIGEIEKKFKAKGNRFYRPHKSYFINLTYFDRLIKTDGSYALMKDGETKIPVSVRKKTKFDRFLKNNF